MVLSLDIETYSSIDLAKSSVYRYSESPDFEILLIAWAIDGSDVRVIDLTQEPMPKWLADAIKDPATVKTAFNANFERVCLSRLLGVPLDPYNWRCTMVQALSIGLPRSLADVGRALGLPEDKQKLKEGKELVSYFCKPCKPTKANGGRTRNRPSDAPEKWQRFIEYNRRDVEAEMEIHKRLSGYPLPLQEWRTYELDQRINDRGVMIDQELMDSALRMSREHTEALTRAAVKITGLSNVNSLIQLKSWLGTDGALDKKAVASLLRSGVLTPAQEELLRIRQELGKTSVSKYEAMKRGLCQDGRVRGLFAFYGAGRTGRWAGRQVQVQNLPQNHIPDLDTARKLVKSGDREMVQLLYGSVPDTLSQLIRTAFVARPGYTFCVADFSAIEARVVAWLAGEEWRQEVFRNGGDIYCASASAMFKVPVVKHGINGHLRQKGKIAELALGYGGSVGALKAMGAIEMGLTEEELQPLVSSWRAANPRITDLWWRVDRAAREAIETGEALEPLPGGMTIHKTRMLLHISLPSGRTLRYWAPAVEPDDQGREQITYSGTEAGKWGRVSSYGPKLVENIVQATARDCLREAMLRVAKRYDRIVMHVHDEMIVEVPEEDAESALRYMLQCMSDPITWAPGLLLKGDGYITKYYRKD